MPWRLGELLATLLVGFVFVESRDWRVQRLNQFQQKYNNSRADIIFLLDVSGSVNDAGFNTEKEFITSLLSEVSVQPIAARVAVISFEQSIYKDIDYINYGEFDKDKCTFTKEFGRIMHRRGPATNMNGAFLQARGILDSAKKNNFKRPNVNTVVILLTDGHWNVGGDPKGTAGSLRERSTYDVEIFSVGVGWVSPIQLESIAGSKDNVIIAKDFSEFADLATRIRGDQIEKLYKRVPPSLCGVTCDAKASCSCGTISGIYTCACMPGYYGPGIPGKCYACPRGTYKTFSSPDPCKPCPENSITRDEGSVDINACVCPTGYTGYPHLGLACSLVTCPSLPRSIPDGRVLNCGGKYKESCTFLCDSNHHIANEFSQTRKLECQADGQWSGIVPQCIAITCQWPPKPSHMTVQCGNNKVGSRCLYTCDKGYTLNGTNERECRSDGQWSGELPFCKAVTCPTLAPVNNVNIYPLSCLQQATKYTDACAYTCQPGFTYVSGTQGRVCQHDGTWSGDELVCKDLTPPSIKCPASIVAETEPGEAFRTLSFDQPTWTDNSVVGLEEVMVTQSPSSVKSPHKFPIGVSLITFTARDLAGNAADCILRVEIRDLEHPKFTFCPSDLSANTDLASKSTQLVTWQAPAFEDNSGKATIVYFSHLPPSEFSVGAPHRVFYRIEDPSRNQATCEFFVKVEAKTCPARDPPANGALSCNYVAMLGHLCTAQCQIPYTFNAPLAPSYLCTLKGIWTSFPSNYPSQWPDCTEMQPQEGMLQRLEFFYYSGSCHESSDARDQIANNFIGVLDRILQDDGGCATAAHARVCKAENVQIRCGKVVSLSSPKWKRSTQNTMTIGVNVEVLSKEASTSQEAALKRLTTTVEHITQSTSAEASRIKVMVIDGDTIILDHVTKVGDVTGVCLQGMVFDTVATKTTNNVKEKKCVACLAGSYFDSVDKHCKQCPVGAYTEQPGRLGCTSCPKGTTTLESGSSNRTKCRAPCHPGSFSSTGLQSCVACQKGSYQPSAFSKSCIACPGSTTTFKEGATSLDECGMLCPRGSFSKSGVEPCSPCSVGHYQPNIGSKQCLACPGMKSTYGEGAHDLFQCEDIDECSSSPCLSGGACRDQVNSFRCECAPGFYGDRCELEKNECLGEPCHGSAVCVDQVNGFECVCPHGFSGKFCSTRSKSCGSDHCDNGGTCYDTPEGASCSCTPGWTGLYCERAVDECASSPCLNAGTCMDSHLGFTCICPLGFAGVRCEQNVDDCQQNGLCKNGGSCVDGDNAFSCSCAPGYAGIRCEVDVDECASNPCRNGAFCVDGVNTYTCKCRATFYGANCENQRTNAEFDLKFDRAVQGYAETTFHEPISAFTVAFWVKAPSNDVEAGTVLSYAVGASDSIMDNALVLRDVNHLLLVVMGEEVATNVSASDDHWHHVAVTWSSSSGSYRAYRDGLKIVDATGFRRGSSIPPGGVFIIGQEQDEVGRNFSAGEAFQGSISQLNVWDYSLRESDITELSRYRCTGTRGNLIAWVDFLEKNSEVAVAQEFCAVKNTRFSTWINSQAPNNGVEQELSACPGRAISAQCASASGILLKNLNLFETTCNGAGFMCRDSDQRKYDRANPMTCPDIQVRFECPQMSENRCVVNSCMNGGTCVNGAYGVVCQCVDGYFGSQCEQALPCRAVASFANGDVVEGGSTFICRPGFVLSGRSVLTCVRGKLDAAVPSCVDDNECSRTNGGCEHQCINTFGSYKCVCNSGFAVQADGKCADEDECSRNNGNCQDKCHNNYGSYSCSCRSGYKISVDKRSCEDVNECASSTHDCQQICINTRGAFKCQCRPGYQLAVDGKSCNAVKCADLLPATNGAVAPTSGSFGTVARYSCARKYRLNGVRERKCMENGQWSGLKPSCEAIACVPLGSLYNGHRQNSGTDVDSTYFYSCLSGYMLVGSANRTCQEDGTWSGTQPRCVPVYCAPLTPPVNGQIVGSSFVSGATVIIRCNEGYMLSPKTSNFRTCESSRLWSGSEPKCVPVQCVTPQSLVNGTIATSDPTYVLGTRLSYGCEAGSGLTGPPERVCQANGLWSGIEPKCLWNSCGYPGLPANGIIFGTDYSFGKSVNFSCIEGYKLVGDSARSCMLSGRWTGALPTCTEIDCGKPGSPQHGSFSGSVFKYKSTVVYDCQPSYSLKGSRQRVCQLDGSWSGSLPTCEAGACGAADLPGPEGDISSRNYPNSYENNDYCRWTIRVANSKKVALDVLSLKTVGVQDRLEIYDGQTGDVLSVLSGVLANPVQITSSSNLLDVKFVTDGENVASGFTAHYKAVTCGGHISSFGGVVESPGYPSAYPSDSHCTWQIVLPSKKFVLKFAQFRTSDQHDPLEAWNSVSEFSARTKIGTFYGSLGSFLRVSSDTGMMFLKFSSDRLYASSGFRATVEKDEGVVIG